ncbi:MAG: DUF1778 domain-containing protein [Cyanobacteria bacterium]|nr:DUF1778 domain-containing protein [Cyanobacteriota bacterium]
MGKKQRNTTRKHQQEVVVLSERDRAVFVDALVSPPAPSKRLAQALMGFWKNKKRRMTGSQGLQVLDKPQKEDDDVK